MGERPIIFISYAQSERAWKEHLVDHLRVLELQRILDLWDDSRIAPGGNLTSERARAIRRAHAAILLISKDYLTDENLWEYETKHLLDRQQNDGFRIIPVLVRACYWQAVPWLSRIPFSPRGIATRSLEAGDRRQREADLTTIAIELHTLFGGSHRIASSESQDMDRSTPSCSASEHATTAPRSLGKGETTSPMNPGESTGSYFERVRLRLNLKTLRACQRAAFSALTNYFEAGGQRAACVMSVGAGKTALGVLACLAFARRRALIVTPGTVILGTFGRALDHASSRNVLYALPGGALTPGCPPPKVLTLSSDHQEAGLRAIREVTREALLESHIIVTNFHSLGTGDCEDDLLSKLRPEDIDLLVIDEAHIAAAESYQRAFSHFNSARALLMSACFQRLDSKPIDADVVYRYRLIDSIADGNAKNLRVHRFAPATEQTTYELVWPNGLREEIQGRDAILELLRDERKLARVTAKSNEPIRQVMRAVRIALDAQSRLMNPIKPRVLFSALGERHAEQIASIATEHGIPSSYVHHAMTNARIKATRVRFEEESGDLQGLVQLKMLGQGYDFPSITIVVPMRPYGSFSEFYQFVGRGIRVLVHPAFEGRLKPSDQYLDVIYHAELGLDHHIEAIYLENDMDPALVEIMSMRGSSENPPEIPGTSGHDIASRPEAFVLFEHGTIQRHIVHDHAKVQMRRAERELEGLAERYAAYVATSGNPVTFQQYVELLRDLHE